MHNAWKLNGDGINLVRKAPQNVPVHFDALPLAITIDLARSALLIVDMQNDFCDPKGWFGQKGISVKPMRKPIAAIARLLKDWRAAGGAVVWLNWGVRPDCLNLNPAIQFQSKRSGSGVGYAQHSPDDHGPSLVPGHWGARVVNELAVMPEDITVFKHRLSGFWDNELDTVLRLQGITTLLFAGVNTDRCVFSTLQDAGFLGYDCVLLADACGTPSPDYVTRAIHFIVTKLHGFVATTEALLPALASSTKPSPKRRISRTPTVNKSKDKK